MDLKKIQGKLFSFFDKLFHNKYLILVLTIIAFCICLNWFLGKMEYAYYTCDDILDFIIDPYNFWHGRIISETIIVAIIKEIPNLLRININDFTFFSKGFFPGGILLLTSFLFVNALYKNIKKNLLYPFVFAFLFFLIYFILIRNGEPLLSILAFFIAYVFPIPILIFHWNKISNLYISEEKITKKDYFILFATCSFLSQANEMMMTVNILLLGFIAFETIVKGIKKEKNNYGWSLSIFLYSFLLSIFLHNLPGSREMQKLYNEFDFSLFSIENFKFYFINCIDKICCDNTIFLSSVVISILIIAFSKEQIKKWKILRIAGYTLTASILFFIALYFLNDSCHYADSIKDNIPSWWFLYFSLLAQWEIILMLIIIFLFKHILLLKKGKIFVSILASFICFFSGNLLKEKSHLLEYNLYSEQNLVNLYKMDKFALYTLETKKYIYIPAEYMHTYYTISKDNETMPLDIVTNNYKNKKYYLSNDKNKKLPYLTYLEEVYGVEADKKIIFDTEKNLIKKFKKDGLTFSKSELEEPDFEELEETYGDE